MSFHYIFNYDKVKSALWCRTEHISQLIIPNCICDSTQLIIHHKYQYVFQDFFLIWDMNKWFFSKWQTFLHFNQIIATWVSFAMLCVHPKRCSNSCNARNTGYALDVWPITGVHVLAVISWIPGVPLPETELIYKRRDPWHSSY